MSHGLCAGPIQDAAHEQLINHMVQSSNGLRFVSTFKRRGQRKSHLAALEFAAKQFFRTKKSKGRSLKFVGCKENFIASLVDVYVERERASMKVARW